MLVVTPDPFEAEAVATFLILGVGVVALPESIVHDAMVISTQVGGVGVALTVNVSVAVLPVSVVPTNT